MHDKFATGRRNIPNILIYLERDVKIRKAIHTIIFHVQTTEWISSYKKNMVNNYCKLITEKNT